MFSWFRRRKKQANKVTLQQAFDRICEELDGDQQESHFFMINKQTGINAYKRWQLSTPSQRVLVTQAEVRNLKQKKEKYFAQKQRGINS
ncbi:hypothetical protein ACQUY5_23705 [Bacillus cereus]|uniref:hypothetical protein n=1 Tax=Bacillus cereus TaxID=1396 RepID=UPI003D1733D9